MELTDQCPPVTPADLDEVERRLGFELPDDLRSHFLSVNGGHPVRNGFPSDGEYFGIEDFLAVKYGSPANSFEQTYESVIVDNDRYPESVIPFAYDSSGDFFLYGLGAKQGQIWFFESEFYDDPDRAWTFLAPTLKDFLDGLVSIPDG